MNTLRTRSLVLSSLCLTSLVFALNANAGTATSNVGVNATINAKCTIDPTTLPFGVYDPLSATDQAGSGNVTVTCTKNAAYKIGLALGSNASGSIRRMADGAGNFLPYEIYSDAGKTTVWDNTTGVSGTAPSKAPIAKPIYGTIPAGTDVPAGGYNDTVVATVTF